MDTLSIGHQPTGAHNRSCGEPLPEALFSPFFDTILTMVNAGELSEGQEYRIPLPIDSAGRTLTLSIVRPTTASPSRDRFHRGGLRPRQLRTVLEFIEAHIAETISLPTLAAVAGLSPSHFVRAFKTSVARTPHAHILMQRIARAMAMLTETDEPLAQIAFACGFSDQSHLTRQFGMLVGITPSRWRRARAHSRVSLAAA